MDVGQLFSILLAGYFLLLAGFAALTTAQALEQDDGANLPMRVFWSLTKTTLFLGFPALIGVLVFLNSESVGSGNSGIMSKNMGFFVLFLFGSLGLLGLWVGAITLGFIGSAVARNLRPLVGAGVVFVFITGAPLFMALVTAVTAAEQQLMRRR